MFRTVGVDLMLSPFLVDAAYFGLTGAAAAYWRGTRSAICAPHRLNRRVQDELRRAGLRGVGTIWVDRASNGESHRVSYSEPQSSTGGTVFRGGGVTGPPGSGIEITARIAREFRGVFWTDGQLLRLILICAVGGVVSGILSAV